MFSIYTSAFNLIKNKFDYSSFLYKACDFAEEVVIAVNTSDDNTLSALEEKKVDFKNLKIVLTDFPYSDPLLDGRIKNEALLNTTQEFKIGLDLDEYIPCWQKPIWESLASSLYFNQRAEAYMIPSVNLYKDKAHYTSITPKWYLHKQGCFRGPVSFARNPDGTVDTSKSDTCELIDSQGNLVRSIVLEISIKELRKNNSPFVVHTGYESLENRILRNKNFWIDHWRVESGGSNPKHKVHSSIDQFTKDGERHLLRV